MGACHTIPGYPPTHGYVSTHIYGIWLEKSKHRAKGLSSLTMLRVGVYYEYYIYTVAKMIKFVNLGNMGGYIIYIYGVFLLPDWHTS